MVKSLGFRFEYQLCSLIERLNKVVYVKHPLTYSLGHSKHSVHYMDVLGHGD